MKCSVILFILAVSFFAQAKDKTNQASSYSAVEFLSVDFEDPIRNPDWPERLTFKNVEMTVEDFIEYRRGRWDLTSHCNGQFARNHVMSGKQYKRNFTEDKYTGVVVRPGSATFNETSGTYTIEDLKDGTFKVTYKNQYGQLAVVERPVIIEQTKEEGIVQFSGTTGQCPDGREVDALYVKISIM